MDSRPLRLLAVENELAHALALRVLLSGQGYELVGLASTAAEARRLFAELLPDMLLLDINLADATSAEPTDGITLAQELLRIRPVPLIFLTSFPTADTFARARQVGPFAFLSKPYDAALINYSIELAIQHFAQLNPANVSAGATSDAGLLGPEGSFFVREQGRLRRVAIADVLRIEADNSHVHLYTTTRKHTVRSSLREVEEKLPSGQFVQVHRSWLVRVSAIDEINYTAGELLVGGQQVPLTRSGREALRPFLPGLAL